MRDIVVTAIVFGSLPFILRRPWLGIIMWCWLSYMNPHKLAWGFAYSMPFALMVALATLVGLLFSREPKKFPVTRETVVLLLFFGWMFVTTNTAFFPELAWPQFEKVAKILLMTFVTLILINTREKLDAMIWVIVLSIGFFGVKGGLFTIATGGSHRVYGPATSFIAGNNEVALALVMIIPLMRYLQLQAKRALVRHGLSAAMFLSAIAAIGSQSRGALLAIVAMGGFLWLKSRGKVLTGVLILAATAVIASLMPESWYERMRTIETYQQDASALGRINAWWVAFNVASARPLVGGGFEMFQAPTFQNYAPEPSRVHDVHSIYFEVLGEHGFVGLTLFLLLYAFAWFTARRIARAARKEPSLKPYGDLALMLQVSLVGYAVGGAFLGLGYFDLPYHLVSALVIAAILLERETAQPPAESAGAAAAARTPAVGVVNRRRQMRAL
ncbi:MAG: putative O-glycosylation ligase, exosortase A system-associated, partial [Burkholderiales bacterium]|nr:putative O-glycosylation ligase, exosortase A system-associated [Burkholderiales bacterium]